MAKGKKARGAGPLSDANEAWLKRQQFRCAQRVGITLDGNEGVDEFDDIMEAAKADFLMEFRRLIHAGAITVWDGKDDFDVEDVFTNGLTIQIGIKRSDD